METWKCKCGKTTVRYNRTEAKVTGKGFIYGQPYEAIACSLCMDKLNIFANVTFVDRVTTAQGRRTPRPEKSERPASRRRRRVPKK